MIWFHLWQVLWRSSTEWPARCLQQSLKWISFSITDNELSLIFVTLRYSKYNNVKYPEQIIIIVITMIIMTWEIILYQLVNEEKHGNKWGRKSTCVRQYMDNYCQRISKALVDSFTEENFSMQRLRDLQYKTATPPPRQRETNRRTTWEQTWALYFPKIYPAFSKTDVILNTWSLCANTPLKQSGNSNILMFTPHPRLPLELRSNTKVLIRSKTQFCKLLQH